ncbi:hypothetical protein N2152v2_005398 [Parachlorella kessleri]
MEACLSALAKLKARTLSPLTDTKATTALWEAACGWADAVKGITPSQEQTQLLREAADVASLLVPTLAKAARLCARDASEAPDSSSEGDSPSVGPQRTTASIAAAVAKAADGLTRLLFKQSTAADPALLQFLADGISAAVFCHSLPAAIGHDIRNLEAVTGMATNLLKGAIDAAHSSSPVHRALAQAVTRPGLLVGLLRGTVQSLDAVAAGQSSASRRDTLLHTTMITLSLLEKLLSAELGRLVADEQLVQQLLRLVVLPYCADCVQRRAVIQNKPRWDSILAGILVFLRTEAIRPHARSLLARAAPPLGSAAWTLDVPAAIAAAAAGSAGSHGSATLGGNLALVFVKVLAEQRALWHQGRKAAHRKSEHSTSQRQRQHGASSPSQVQAAVVATLASLLARLLQLLPCTLDSEQVEALYSDDSQRRSSGKASGTSVGGLCQASTLVTVQHAAPEWAGRAAEAVFLQGVVAVAAALLDLKDSGGVPHLVCSLDDLPLPEANNEDAVWEAAFAVCSLGDTLPAFQCWAEGTLEPTDVRWVPSDLAAACGAAEVLMRLAPQLQQGPRGVCSKSERAPRNLHWMAGRWFEAVQDRLLSVHVHKGQQQQPRVYTTDAAAVKALTVHQARTTLLPAIHLATTAIKFAHVSRSMPAVQQGVLYESQEVMTLVCASAILTTSSVVSSLLRRAYPESEAEGVPLDIQRKVDALEVAMIDVTGVLARDAASLLSGAAAVAVEGPEVLISVLLDLTRCAMNASLPGKPAAVLLAPAVMEAGLRLLLATCKPIKTESYGFWIIAGKHLVVNPRLCAEVVGRGLLAESAAWLAQQLDQGRLAPESASRLVACLDALFSDAVNSLVQLASVSAAQATDDAKTQEPGAITKLVFDFAYVFNMALAARDSSGPYSFPQPTWRFIGSPGG